MILSELDKPESLITFVQDRPGHDRRYAIDATKIKRELGWEPLNSFESGIKKTIQWYLDQREWLDRVQSGEYKSYYQQQYGNRFMGGPVDHSGDS